MWEKEHEWERKKEIASVRQKPEKKKWWRQVEYEMKYKKTYPICSKERKFCVSKSVQLIKKNKIKYIKNEMQYF